MTSAAATAPPPDTPPEAPAGPTVVGYVEAATGTQILGWAWAPAAPAARLLVQALLDGHVVAEAPADRPRDDLARNGIGDGNHAFDLTLPDSAQARLADVRIVAHDANGRVVPLGVPPPAEAAAERLDRLQRGIDTLIASQRVLHRNLQAALLAPKPEEDAAGTTDLATQQAEVARQLGTLEVFAMRLDERLAALATAPASPTATPPPSRATLAALVLGGAALLLSVWGLLRSLPG
jgi:hypothetical protein